jgi:hypothetical protein
VVARCALTTGYYLSRLRREEAAKGGWRLLINIDPVVARWALTTGYYLSRLRRKEALKQG